MSGLEIVSVSKRSRLYPERLKRFLGPDAPQSLYAIGDIAILDAAPSVGLFCSVRCPGKLILRTYDLSRRLRDEGRLVISGFHSPMEKECLVLLLRGRQPIVVCLARSLGSYRIPDDWREAVAAGRLLLLSGFGSETRATVDQAIKRNLHVAALADEIFISHAEAESKTEAFARTVASWGKPLSTFDDKHYNETLFALGAKPLQLALGGR